LNTNEKYSRIWTDNFDTEKALSYHEKFYKKFEKHIKHRQQLRIISRYLRPGMSWLDAPVGSARIMGDIDHPREHCFIFDRSVTFLNVSKCRLHLNDENVFHGDLFDISLERSFDFITCNNTLFAFEDFEYVVSKLCSLLSSGGIIVFDVVNRTLYDQLPFESSDPMRKSKGWLVDDVPKFAEKSGMDVLQIIPHDYYDNEYFLRWRRRGGFFQKKVRDALWHIVNRCYFGLQLFQLFDLFENRRKLNSFNKLIVVLRKSANH
jgi:SAM-dependent methyltransferase